MTHFTTGNPEVANLFRQAQRGDAASLTQLMDQHDGLSITFSVDSGAVP